LQVSPPVDRVKIAATEYQFKPAFRQEVIMGRGILLWLLGIPIPLIIIILLFLR